MKKYIVTLTEEECRIHGELLISSVFGLGEAPVSGQVEPDEFRLRKSAEVLSAHIVHRAPSLTDMQLKELASLLLTIEKYYGAPQDVEWCHDGTQFWIVQSQPVTTASTTRKTDTEWTRANLREVLPDLPSHLAATWTCDALNRAWRAVYGRLIAPDAELPRHAIQRLPPQQPQDRLRLPACRETPGLPASVSARARRRSAGQGVPRSLVFGHAHTSLEDHHATQ